MNKKNLWASGEVILAALAFFWLVPAISSDGEEIHYMVDLLGACVLWLASRVCSYACRDRHFVFPLLEMFVFAGFACLFIARIKYG